MLVLVNITLYLLIYVHRWFGFVSKIEFYCFRTQIGGAGVIDADYRGPVGVITLMLISSQRLAMELRS